MTRLTNAADKDRIARHASPVAIEALLGDARAERARWDREVAWWERLLAARRRQVEAGEWPPQPTLSCPKAPHTGTGYLHAEDDDRPYDIDGVTYCGRCHYPWPHIENRPKEN